MIVLAGAGVAAWFGTGVFGSALMARRGYDRIAWLVLGVLLGPIAMVWAAAELAWMIPRAPDVIDHATPQNNGRAGALVVLRRAEPSDVADALRGIDAGRLVLADVLSFDGAKLVEQMAADNLRRIRLAIGRADAGLVLLFGVPADAIARYAHTSSLEVVLVERTIRRLGSGRRSRRENLFADAVGSPARVHPRPRGSSAVVIRAIDGFHPDELGDWVAELSCLHNQHVRHRPPFQDRDWVTTEAGRAGRVGSPINCPLCDRLELPADLELARTAGPFDAQTTPAALRRDHVVADRTWGVLRVLEGAVGFSIETTPLAYAQLHAGEQRAIPPAVRHHLDVGGPVKLVIDFFVKPH